MKAILSLIVLSLVIYGLLYVSIKVFYWIFKMLLKMTK